MSDEKLQPKLWVERSVEETIDVYKDWADNYDQDVTERGYKTPARIAQALGQFTLDKSLPVLDFGCGTGISGKALKSEGFTTIDGTDITAEMLAKAEPQGIYRKLWRSEAGAQPSTPGSYAAIVATGVVSLGAAPPETLTQMIDGMGTGGLIALSYNDPTLENGSYDSVLDAEVDANRVEVLFRENGPHLSEIGMNSDVIVLRRL